MSLYVAARPGDAATDLKSIRTKGNGGVQVPYHAGKYRLALDVETPSFLLREWTRETSIFDGRIVVGPRDMESRRIDDKHPNG
jgi:hypothetical protein